MTASGRVELLHLGAVYRTGTWIAQVHCGIRSRDLDPTGGPQPVEIRAFRQFLDQRPSLRILWSSGVVP